MREPYCNFCGWEASATRRLWRVDAAKICGVCSVECDELLHESRDGWPKKPPFGMEGITHCSFCAAPKVRGHAFIFGAMVAICESCVGFCAAGETVLNEALATDGT